MTEQDHYDELNRRDFLKGGSLATLMMLMGGVPLRAEDAPKTVETAAELKPSGPALRCAVIGCGTWGREILKSLARLPKAAVVGICDTYASFLRRAQESAPKAEKYDDYRKVLDQKEVQAVFIATPSHQHREIAVAALQAGKHVYCEAPLATTIEDARAIALAAKGSTKLNFQSGQQNRSDPQLHYVWSFVRTGVLGDAIKARSQWHKKQSWRHSSPNPDRETELNWRLRKESSLGLIGEIGIHQVDVAAWFLMSLPEAVTGFGTVRHWKDGREVPDTVQAVFEFPGGVLLDYDGTLGNSFDADYDMFYGTDCTIMIRDHKAWMFKEVDSPLLGWEVYARKEGFYKESGIVLAANATKLAAQGRKPTQDTVADEETPLYYALDAFLTNTNAVSSAVEDFVANFGENDKALREYLAGIIKTKLPCAGYKEGFEAAVSTITANQAILKGQRIVFQKDWFELA